MTCGGFDQTINIGGRILRLPGLEAAAVCDAARVRCFRCYDLRLP